MTFTIHDNVNVVDDDDADDYNYYCYHDVLINA